MLKMRELSTPSLFDVPPAVLPAPAVEAPAREDRGTDQLAKDFIRWCFSFGSDFRNSPDVINLRTWCGKAKFKLHDHEESEVLVEARRLYFKRIEQTLKKAETPPLQDTGR